MYHLSFGRCTSYRVMKQSKRMKFIISQFTSISVLCVFIPGQPAHLISASRLWICNGSSIRRWYRCTTRRFRVQGHHQRCWNGSSERSYADCTRSKWLYITSFNEAVVEGQILSLARSLKHKVRACDNCTTPPRQPTKVWGSAQGGAPAQFYVGALGTKSTVRPEQKVYSFLSFSVFSFFFLWNQNHWL